MIIASLQVGKRAVKEYREDQVQTAVFKEPVTGPVWLGKLGLAGDEVADHVHHGGPDKAALVYAAAHYPHWQALLGREPGPAALGENMTVSGATEESVCIGDTYKLGGAVVQISQPRVPCFKMNLRQGHAEVLPEIVRTGYSGFYLRVLEEGPVQAGDEFTLLSRPADAPTVAFANRVFHHDRTNREAMTRLLEAEGLAAVWQTALRKRLGDL